MFRLTFRFVREKELKGHEKTQVRQLFPHPFQQFCLSLQGLAFLTSQSDPNAMVVGQEENKWQLFWPSHPLSHERGSTSPAPLLPHPTPFGSLLPCLDAYEKEETTNERDVKKVKLPCPK